jgi:hypothetical protein
MIQATRYLECSSYDEVVSTFLEAIRVCSFDKLPTKKKIPAWKEYKIQVETEVENMLQRVKN